MTVPLHPVPRARVVELLDRMRRVRVAVVGDVMLDRYLLGDVERISPEAPVPIIIVEEERDVPGGAANVAANASAIGATARLVGTSGDDSAGQVLRDALTALGLSTDGITAVPGRPTTTKTRIIARSQQVVRIDREVTNPLPERFRGAVLEAARRAIADSDVLLIEDYDKGTIDAGSAMALVAAAREAGIPILVDPKERNFFDFAGATVFKPNRRELEAAFKTHYMGDDTDLEEARVKLGVDHLLLTLGSDGMALVSAGHGLRQTPSIAHEVFDVSGAGDTVAAWTGTALGAGADITEAAWLANLAAGVEVGKRGTATVSAAELLHAFDEFNRG